jgi:spore maturation protein CgeB
VTSDGLNIAFFGSSLVSSRGNRPCTYYRGIIRALHERGHRVTFYEPDAFDRQRHRDIADPSWARVVVYSAHERGARRAVNAAAGSDVMIKATGVGVFDQMLATALLELPGDAVRVLWDVQVATTLAELGSDPGAPLRTLIGEFDLIVTQTGGPAVVERYRALGARCCETVYSAMDPRTHHPVPHRAELARDVVFLGDREPGLEPRVDEFFFRIAERLPQRSFLLAGAGWGERRLPRNVRYIGPVSAEQHNVLNSTPPAVLIITSDGPAQDAGVPGPRLFEAAGTGACVLTDDWDGIDRFLAPGHEIVVARDGQEMAERLGVLDRSAARRIGAAARRRVLTQHTYAVRAEQVESLLVDSFE